MSRPWTGHNMAEGDPRIGRRDPWRGDIVALSTPQEAKPTLYHAGMSYYSQIGMFHTSFRLVNHVLTWMLSHSRNRNLLHCYQQKIVHKAISCTISCSYGFPPTVRLTLAEEGVEYCSRLIDIASAGEQESSAMQYINSETVAGL